jgi:hypothetical protein
MKKEELNLAQEDVDAIQALVSQKSLGVLAFKKVLEYYMNELKDIRNIDPKGNMGLQTLAAQLAYEKLEDFFKSIFLIEASTMKPDAGSKMSQWR